MVMYYNQDFDAIYTTLSSRVPTASHNLHQRVGSEL